MKETPWSEKRENCRMRSRIQTHYEQHPTGKYGDFLAQDVSAGGMRVIANEFMPRSALLTVHMQLSNVKVLDFASQVRWAQKMPNTYCYQIGLEFVDVNPVNKREITAYINNNKQI